MTWTSRSGPTSDHHAVHRDSVAAAGADRLVLQAHDTDPPDRRTDQATLAELDLARAHRPTPPPVPPTGSPKPRRLPSTRRALTEYELAQIYAAARTNGNDVVLGTLLLRLHVETAARRGGILGLHLADLDTELCVLLLRENGGTVRGQPITPSLTRALADHATRRGAVLPTDS